MRVTKKVELLGWFVLIVAVVVLLVFLIPAMLDGMEHGNAISSEQNSLNA